MTEDNKKNNKGASQPGDSQGKPKNQNFQEDLKRRVKENKPMRWVRFGLVSLIFFLWVAWMGNWWLSILYILLIDIYITGYIPFTWWKKSKNKTVKSVMSWVDAIVYALILVYFIFAFLGQNYMIPSSSLEKTLLTGDYLVVNKVTYGPRVPMTPVHFPLVHNTMPVLGTDSYLDAPSVKYRRLKGLRNVEAGDIVVFNFPAGDTVATKYEESANYYDLVAQFGHERVNADKEQFGEIRYRPVDRRTNYVKRAVGLPGERLRIEHDTLYIDGVAQPFPKNVQFGYFINATKPITEELAYKYGITPSDIMSVNGMANEYLQQQAFFNPSLPIYQMPLTEQMIADMTADGVISAIVKCNELFATGRGSMFPTGLADDWSVGEYGGEEGILIPKKGLTVPLTEENWLLYNRAIRNYENHPEAYFANGQAYINGQPAKDYMFEMDYYFMMGDNRDNSLDSRFWGFVPEDHIVGTPLFVVASFDKDRSLFNGGIRWDRIFRDANPDK